MHKNVNVTVNYCHTLCEMSATLAMYTVDLTMSNFELTLMTNVRYC